MVISAKSSPLLSGCKEAYFHMAKDILHELETISDFWKKIMQLVSMYMDWAYRDPWPKLCHHPGFDLTVELFTLSLKSNQVGLNHSSITYWMCSLKKIPSSLGTTISFPLIGKIIELFWELNLLLYFTCWATTIIISTYSYFGLPVSDTVVDTCIRCPFYQDHGHHHCHM